MRNQHQTFQCHVIDLVIFQTHHLQFHRYCFFPAHCLRLNPDKAELGALFSS